MKRESTSGKFSLTLARPCPPKHVLEYTNEMFQECGYDGGDCCECDCVASSGYACESFNCVDLASDCVDSMAVTYPTCSGTVNYIGDGYCDLENNNEVS